MSTDYSPLQPEYYDSYSGEIVRLNERWHTWFCIYKREALQCTVSHRYYEEMLPGSGRRNIWDSSGYFQKALKDMGYELAVLDPQYRRCFIHYGAFSKNLTINERNVGLYRFLQITRKRGLLGPMDVLTPKAAALLTKLIFGKLRRSRYWPEYGGKK